MGSRRNWVIDQQHGYGIAGVPGADDIAAVPGFRTHRRVYLLAMLLLAAIVVMMFVLLVDLRQHLFAQWRDERGPGFWAGYEDRRLIAVVIGTCIAGIGVFAWRAPVGTRVCALFLLLAAAGAAEVAIVRAYFGIEGATVTIRPLLPWQPAIRFALADAIVVRRGCARSPGGIAQDDLIFQVRYGRGRDDMIDLGGGVGTGNAAQWLEAMRADRNAAPPSPVASRRGGPHDGPCLDDMTAELSERQADALKRLLD